MDNKQSILIVDDHSLVRNGTRLALQSLSDQITVYEAKNGSQAIDQVDKHSDLDLILLDIGLPDISGIELLKTFRNTHPLIPIIMISASDNSSQVESAVKNGARGFIHKSEDESIMNSAIQLVLSGGLYFPPSLLSRQDTPSGFTSQNLSINNMTTRQVEVVKLLTAGKPNKVIASELGCTESTVRVHVTAIFKALGVSNRTEAAMKVRNLGLLEE